MDVLCGENMPKSGVVDTVTDRPVDSPGRRRAAGIGYSYVRDGDPLFADRLARKFVAKKP